MIKIEISDVEKLDAATLHATGKYFIDLSCRREQEESRVHKHPSEESKPEIEVPVRAPLTVDEQLDLQQLHGTSGEPTPMTFEDHEREREFYPVVPHDEFISPPVPPETVEIPAPSPAQVFAPAAPISSVDLDTDGLPWDFRIHARTKTKMKDGSWKKLRGVGPELVKKVEAELKAAVSAPAAPSIPVPPPAIPAIPVPPASTAPGFADLMTLVTKAITEGKLKRDQVTEILKPFGIPSLPLVSTRLDLVPTIIAALNGVINAAQ